MTATCCARGRPRGAGSRVSAPSTLGTFLRAFTFGHVRQLDRVLADARAGVGGRRRARATGGWSSMSTASSARSIGYDKQGAGYGYTHKRGYHPILATRADTGEVLHIRAAEGVGEHSRGDAAVRRGADRPRRPRRRDRREAAARRLGVLEQQDLRPGWSRGLDVLDRRAPASPRQRRDRGDPRERLAARWRTTPPTSRRRSPRPRSATGG